MAYQQSSPGDNPAGGEDLYSDGGNPSAADPAEPEARDDEGGGETALLPKSILAGKEFKPGDEIVLKIDAIHDDQVSVSYAAAKSDQESPAENLGEGGEKAEVPSGMASMMED